ncbi:MAG: cell wall-binding protein [Methylobacter sp.]|nr:MAG: cell wall-binding protein [Methylobacter sp.]PPD17589.1 MAG: cell wall-binding protein [Methylobacter sp.]PPD36809.1 MAG: cell wall-binding protein [Methylomonas sp.]
MADKVTPIERARKPKHSGGGNGSGGKPQSFGDYIIKDGAFYQLKQVRNGSDGGGTVEIPLCNFVAEILEETVQNDGLDEKRCLRITGTRSDGYRLPEILVPTTKFFGNQSNWAAEYWSTLVFVPPGFARPANLRAAVELYSKLNGDISRRTVYGYTGWTRIEGQWRYLTGSGGLGEDGLNQGHEVQLGQGSMQHYQLPEPLVGELLKPAAANLTKLLAVCSDKRYIGAALLAAIAKAPLGECVPNDFVLWLHGSTGSRKSSLAAIALACFGNGFKDSFPASWQDSASNLFSKAFACKDGLLVADDFKPAQSRIAAQRLHELAEKFIRASGNHTGPGRNNPDGSVKSEKFNRSLTISTAEDLPLGESLIARCLCLELDKHDVSNAVLSELQAAARNGEVAGLMAAYIQYLAPRLDELKQRLPESVRLLAESARKTDYFNSHPRAPNQYANLVAGMEVFTGFLADSGALTEADANNLLSTVEDQLKQAFLAQAGYVENEDEALRSITLMRSLLANGNAYVASKITQEQPEQLPFAWGWVADESGNKQYKPKGNLIGWYAGAIGDGGPEVWLEPNAAFKELQEYASRQGEPFLINRNTLWRRLFQKGYVIKTEQRSDRSTPRLEVRRTIAGRRVTVIILPAEVLVDKVTQPESS